MRIGRQTRRALRCAGAVPKWTHAPNVGRRPQGVNVERVDANFSVRQRLFCFEQAGNVIRMPVRDEDLGNGVAEGWRKRLRTVRAL